ncbi:MAG: BatD family protein [Pseudomonadota bacterium]
MVRHWVSGGRLLQAVALVCAMVTAIALFLIGASPALAQGNQVAVDVDRNPVNANESFTLTYTLEGSFRVSPDFSLLSRDFEVLQQNQSSSVTMGSGGTTMQQVWTLVVLPKRTGTLQIPSIRFGSKTSPVVAMQVLEATPGNAGDKDFLVEVDVSPKQVYVQQQVLVTVRAMRAARTTGQTLSKLTLTGVDTVEEPLVDNRTYQSRRGGRVYNVHEFVYAVFPQSSGELVVEPLQYEVEVPGQRWRSQIQRVFSDAVAVTVSPAPAAFSGPVWLPSTDVQLKEEWPTEPPLLRAGEAVTRTLVLSAAGLTSVQLPPLESLAPDAFKQYADQPVLENGVTELGVIGMRKEQVALLPTRPGRYALPAVEVAWWDTSAGQTRVARLPERWVEVLPGAAATLQQTLNDPAIDVTGQVLQQVPETVSDPGIWRWLSLVAIAGWLVTTALLLASRRRQHEAPVSQSAPLRRDPVSVKKALSQARARAAANAMPETRDALLAFGKAGWPDDVPASLGELARRCDDPLAAEISALSRALYGASPEPWQGQALAAALSRWKPSKNRRGSGNEEVLATL